jgi:ribosomal protein S12 methylthiotransferase accessory factor
VIAAVSRRVEGGSERLSFGFGAHLDPRIALLRALTELNQLEPPAGEVPGDDAYARWLREASLANQPYLAPLPGVAPRGPADFGARASGDLARDLASCRGIVEARGHEVLVLDQTRPEVGMPVAKVIVPGLRHFWPRFGPGRLFDVPVALGWKPRALEEADLNPIVVFF